MRRSPRRHTFTRNAGNVPMPQIRKIDCRRSDSVFWCSFRIARRTHSRWTRKAPSPMVSLSFLCFATLVGCSGTVAGPQSSAADGSQVALSPSSLSLQPGETARIVAELQNPAGARVEGAHVRWVSDDTNVARVDNDGRVTGVAPGTTRVTASLGEGRGRVQSSATVSVPSTETLQTATSAFPGAQGWGAQALSHVTVRASRFFGSLM